MIMIDLAEFVSDYMAIETDKPITAKDIAEQYLDTCESDAEVTPELIAQIEYYLP